MSGVKGKGGGKARLPTNKTLFIPGDALWDYRALRIVLKEIRLHRRETVVDVANRLGVQRYQLRYLEAEQDKWGKGQAPDWFLRDWARSVGYTLHISSRMYRLEKGAYSR